MEREKTLSERLAELPPSADVQELQRQYGATGGWDPALLSKVLGDPNKGVQAGPEGMRKAFGISDK